MKKKFYIIEYNYVGPNQGDRRWVDFDSLEIQTEPGVTNLSHEPKITGWLGTYNDISQTAHGEYPSLKAALKYISDHWYVRPIDEDEEPFDDESIVWAGKFGSYKPCSEEGTDNMLYEYTDQHVTGTMSDAELEQMAKELIEDSHEQGCALYEPRAFLERVREQKREKEEEEKREEEEE